MIVGVENREGNTNVSFHQTDALKHFFTRLEERGIKIVRYRADCGSYSEDIVKMISVHSQLFYSRVSNCQTRKIDYEKHENWKSVEINFEQLEVSSFDFVDFMPEAVCLSD